jgi:chromosome segregation ATPase
MDEDKVLAAIAGLETRLHEGLHSLGAEVGSLKGDLTGLRAEVGGLKGDMTSLRTEVGSLKGDMTSLRTEVGSLKGDVTSLRTEIIDLRVGLMSRMERLEDGMSQIKDEITVNLAIAERGKANSDQFRKEIDSIGDELRSMWRIVRRVQSEWDAKRQG